MSKHPIHGLLRAFAQHREVRHAAMTTNTPEQFPIAENKKIQQYKAKFAA